MRYEIDKIEASSVNPARYVWVYAHDESFSEPRLILLDYGNAEGVIWVNLFGGWVGGRNVTITFDDLIYAGIMPSNYEKVADYTVKRFYKIS